MGTTPQDASRLQDALTGLPGTPLLTDRLAVAIRRARRHRLLVAVLLVEVDALAEVHRMLGAAAGDRLLVEVADRLSGATREVDTVARRRDGEFVVLCEDLPASGAVTEILRRIAGAMTPPVQLAGQQVPATVSVGVAVGSGAEPAETLYRFAATALARARRRGPGGHELFDVRTQARMSREPEVEDRLRAALAGHEATVSRGDVAGGGGGGLALHYQPIVDAGGRTVGVEALLRWPDRHLGVLGARDVLAVAHRAGLVAELGRWVLQRACTDAAAWPDRFLAVNISGEQLADGDLARTVADLLTASGREPGSLWLELSERDIPDRDGSGRRELAALRRLGARLVVDDFGGTSSGLGRLRAPLADAVKIDPALVGGIADDPAARAIVRGVLLIAGELGIQAVAEGVENAADLDTLRELGCPLFQGYLVGRPAPALPAQAPGGSRLDDELHLDRGVQR